MMSRQINYGTSATTRPGRRVPRPLGSATSGGPDDYATRLLKYVPSEAVGAFIAARTAILASDQPEQWALWVVVAVIAVLTPLYLAKAGVRDRLQQILSTGAFLVWAAAIGEPFSYLNLWSHGVAAALMVLYTAALPLAPSPAQRS